MRCSMKISALCWKVFHCPVRILAPNKAEKTTQLLLSMLLYHVFLTRLILSKQRILVYLDPSAMQLAASVLRPPVRLLFEALVKLSA